MKFDKKLIEELKKYWNNENTSFLRFIVEEKEKSIQVKRYDGNGRPETLKIVYNNLQLENYINELKENKKIYLESIK